MDESLHLQFAYELAAEEGALSQRVLHELVSGPRRYAELEPLQRGRHENALVDALRRLQGQGLVDRRRSHREVVIQHTFEITSLGMRAQEVTQKLRPVEGIPRMPARRQRSELALARPRLQSWTLGER